MGQSGTVQSRCARRRPSIITRRLTYNDLRQTPGDGKRYELIGGELLVAAAPAAKHQGFCIWLVDLLYDHQRAGVGEAFVAPVDVRLRPHGIVQPDLHFILKDRLQIY